MFEVWGKLSDRNCENEYFEIILAGKGPMGDGRLDFVNGNCGSISDLRSNLLL